MGLLDKLGQTVKSLLSGKQVTTGFRTFTEHSPAFSSWDGQIYEQLQIRAIIERISVACSKLRPEFVTPEGSGGALPRVQGLFTTSPNPMQTWPDFLRVTSSRLFADTVAYVVPGYDQGQKIVALYSLKPTYTEVVEYEGEPFLRFHLATGEVVAYPFYDVAILTRFQLDSDIFGGGNDPLTPTLRLMDAQRQAEEIALKTSADIRFIGKLSGMVHERDMERKRQRFAESNLSRSNETPLMVYDQTWDTIEQLRDVNHFTVSESEMARIDKALYAYFGINERILTNSYDEQQWNAFYEGVVEPFALMLAQRLTKMLLTPTQVRKGNHVMFSAGYLEYASTDSKIKVANLYMTAGVGTRNEVRDVFQLPRTPGGDVFMIRGEYYMVDADNNIIAESGGRTDHGESWSDDLSDLDEPDQEVGDATARMLQARLAEIIDRRVATP